MLSSEEQSQYSNRHYKRIVCKDGFSFSCQAGQHSYSTPRKFNADFYTHVELGFPSDPEPLLMPFAEDNTRPTATVYPWVPSDLVRHLIDKHGGITEGEVPKGVPVYGVTHPKQF